MNRGRGAGSGVLDLSTPDGVACLEGWVDPDPPDGVQLFDAYEPELVGGLICNDGGSPDGGGDGSGSVWLVDGELVRVVEATAVAVSPVEVLAGVPVPAGQGADPDPAAGSVPVSGADPGSVIGSILAELADLAILADTAAGADPDTGATSTASSGAAGTGTAGATMTGPAGNGGAGGGVAGVGAFELGELVAGCQRVISETRALQATLITALSNRPEMAPLPGDGRRLGSVSPRACTALELTDPLKLTSGQAERLVAESTQLVEDFPRTHAALAAGRVDERRARVILSELRSHDRDIAAAVEAAVIGQAPSMDPRQLRRAIKRLIHELAPATAEERRAAAEEGRYVRVSPAEDGMAWLEALIRAEDATAIDTVLDAGAKTLKRRDAAAGDPHARTSDQRRADVLTHLAWTALATGRISTTNHTEPEPSHGGTARARPGHASQHGPAKTGHAGGADAGAQQATTGADRADTAGDTDTDTTHRADTTGSTRETASPDQTPSSGQTPSTAPGPSETNNTSETGETGDTAANSADATDTPSTPTQTNTPPPPDPTDPPDPTEATVPTEAPDVTDPSEATGAPPGWCRSCGTPTSGAVRTSGTGTSGSRGSPFGTPDQPSNPGSPDDPGGPESPGGPGDPGGAGGPGGPGELVLSTAHGRPVSVQVTVPLSTLIGLDEHPGELTGYGPIPAHIARHLSVSGLWQWVGTHDLTGEVLSHGRTRYTPTQDLTDHVILRDRTCRAPGCAAPAQKCDLDHTIYYPLGPTAACNLGLYCRKHHRAKHRTRWQVEQPHPGTFHWTSPTGRTATTTPEPVGPTGPTNRPPSDHDPPKVEPPPPAEPRASPTEPDDDAPPF